MCLIIWLQPEDGMWEVGARKDRNAETLRHGKWPQLTAFLCVIRVVNSTIIHRLFFATISQQIINYVKTCILLLYLHCCISLSLNNVGLRSKAMSQRPIATHGIAWSVCVSVCGSLSWACLTKTAELIEMLFRMLLLVAQGVHIPHGKLHFWGVSVP